MSTTTTAPPRGAETTTPWPQDSNEWARWNEARKRRNLLDGTWRPILGAAIQERVGSQRADVWGQPILECNLFENIARELSVLYDVAPHLRHDAGTEAIKGLVAGIGSSGLWGMMPGFQAYTLGLRQMLLRTHVSASGRISYRQVFPDMVTALSGEDQPDLPIAVSELRQRTNPSTGRSIWTLDILDVSDQENPVYRIVRCKPGLQHGEDVTALYLGRDLSGDAYPYRRADGVPILPYTLYHAQRSGDRLWDPYRWSELVEASVSLTVKSNLFEHSFLMASHPQRYMANLRPAGSDIVGKDGTKRAEIPADPAYIMILETPETEGVSTGQPMIGQWQPGADIGTLDSVLQSKAAQLATQAGVPFSDLQRLGGTARSGAAISLTNEGKRVQQRRFASSFRDSDERLIATTACLLNRATGTSYPEQGYTVQYQELPLSPEEKASRREDVLALIEAGLLSPVQGYQELNPGISPEQARSDLAQIAASRAYRTL